MTERKRWITMIAVSVLCAAGVGTMIYLQHQKIVQRRTEIATLKKKIDQDRELIKKTPDLTKEVIIQRETDVTIKEILSDETDINNFVRTLRRFEEESGVSISSIKQQRGQSKKKKEDFDRVGYTLSFDADAFQLLAFMNLVESDKRLMSVPAFKLSASRASGGRKQAQGTPRHKVQMDIETYVYSPKGGGNEVKIDHYERKRDLLISEISKRTSELKVPTFDYKGPRGRRDPWVDPRIPVDGPDGPGLTIEEQIALVDGLVEKAREAQQISGDAKGAENLIAEMKARALLEEKLTLLEEEIRRVQKENGLTFLPANRRFESEVVLVVASLREASGATDPATPSVVALREAAEAMERHIEASEFELALDAFKTVETRLAAAEKDNLKLPLVQTLRELERLCKTVLEFEKIDLTVGGIALYEDRRPVALINGQAVSEGELLGDELFVRNIRKDQIEFAFRGMVLAIPVESGSTLPQ